MIDSPAVIRSSFRLGVRASLHQRIEGRRVGGRIWGWERDGGFGACVWTSISLFCHSHPLSARAHACSGVRVLTPFFAASRSARVRLNVGFQILPDVAAVVAIGSLGCRRGNFSGLAVLRNEAGQFLAGGCPRDRPAQRKNQGEDLHEQEHEVTRPPRRLRSNMYGPYCYIRK